MLVAADGTSAPTPAQRAASVIRYALAQIGTPYVYGGDGAGGFDCSGLTQQAFRAAGVALPRTAQQQYDSTTRVLAPQVGDLVFFSDTANAGNVTHVGLVVGADRMVDAPHTGAQVRTEAISTFGSVVGYGRPLAGVDATDPGLTGAALGASTSSGGSTSSSSSGGITGTLRRLSVETVLVGGAVGLVVLAVLRGTDTGRAASDHVGQVAKQTATTAGKAAA